MDEFERIARLRRVFTPHAADASLLLGIGDDAAVLERPGENLALSVDTAVDGVHFRREFADWRTLAARAFSAALSDLAAMGAQPRAALLSLIAPAALSDAEFDELVTGYGEAAAHYACPVIGGNLSRGSELSLTTTVLGEVRGVGLTRHGARPGHEIYVTGVLGAAGLGLALLLAGTPERGPAFVEHWRRPQARIAEGRALAGVASAAIDVSDGAIQDLGHLCAASGVGAQLNAAALPTAPGFSELATELGHVPLDLALTAGEDYELIYTLPPGAASGTGTRIGRITEQPGIALRDEQGRVLQLRPRGYRHFQA
ncbi:MAG TPA: thiamine-phosphate kinase [Polyangiales bacterium]|nr:thiamine-phosphate kinase [Polyangiales bacterium]